MTVMLDTEHERVVEIEQDDDTDGRNIYELKLDGERRWQIGHIYDDELEHRINSGRYKI